MGTNYYIDNLVDPYEDGGKWHIGKKSAGWDFIWADPPHDRIAMRWLRYAATMDHLLVVDEYGRGYGRLVDFVKERLDSDAYNQGKGWS